MQDSFKLLTGRENNHLIDHEGFLIHKGILESFIKLQARAKKEINSDLKIISSFRDYNRQEIIWNNKASGYRPIYNDQNEVVEIKSLNDSQIVNKIMRFSALPGTSRHHWGTDVDIYDAKAMRKEEVQLVHSECIDNGPCSQLHSWLDEQVAQNKSFNFFRPYEYDRGGVSVEKWHLSYAPISEELFSQYTLDTFIENIHHGAIVLRDVILEDPQFFFETYVKNINLA